MKKILAVLSKFLLAICGIWTGFCTPFIVYEYVARKGTFSWHSTLILSWLMIMFFSILCLFANRSLLKIFLMSAGIGIIIQIIFIATGVYHFSL